MDGRINSVQTMGTLDGPGVRFVLFMQGCKLRCGYCHNPETWDLNDGYTASVDEIVEKVIRYKAYFGQTGGITVSGGEPLLQAEFVYELFSACKVNGIHTALDTSGSLWNSQIERLLDVTDLCLLDYKMTNNEDYINYTGCSIDTVLSFLQELDKRNIDTWLRQVVVGGITDSTDNIKKLAQVAKSHKCVKKVELLPFHKMCSPKYEQMGIKFRFGDIDETTNEKINELTSLLLDS